jgi:hypothetical protein
MRELFRDADEAMPSDEGDLDIGDSEAAPAGRTATAESVPAAAGAAQACGACGAEPKDARGIFDVYVPVALLTTTISFDRSASQCVVVDMHVSII